jgi:hypothetical protein
MNTKKISIQLSDEYLVIKIPKSEINFPNIELPKLELFEDSVKINPYKELHQNTIGFFKDIAKKYGTNVKISRNDNFVKELRYKYRINDPHQNLRNLRNRGIIDLVYQENQKRIDYFILKDNAQWI